MKPQSDLGWTPDTPQLERASQHSIGQYLLYKGLDNEDGTLSWSWLRNAVEEREKKLREIQAMEAELEARVEARVAQLRLENAEL